MSFDNFNHLVLEFCKAIDLANPTTNDAGFYSFVVGGDQNLEIQYDFDNCMISFFIVLGQISSPSPDEVIRDILDANVLWRGTGGGTLGLDSESGQVTMAYQESAANMSFSRFEAILNLLISNSEVWVKRIASDTGVAGNNAAVGTHSNWNAV